MRIQLHGGPRDGETVDLNLEARHLTLTLDPEVPLTRAIYSIDPPNGYYLED